MEEFLFTHLSTPTSIRVLVLHISKAQASTTTSFSLKEVDLQSDPEYEALSYTWGETESFDLDSWTYQWKDTETFPIEIASSGSLHVTKNLHGFLAHLAENAPPGESMRTIWADQVCINQLDVQERNNQVSMMRNIYIKARRTLIWLGTPDEDMMVVSDILQAMNTPRIGCDENRNPEILSTLTKRVKEVIAFESGSKWPRHLNPFRSIFNILNMPWFSRAWVVQEAALSREPLLIFDSKTCNLDALENLAVVILHLEIESATPFLQTSQLPPSQIIRSRGIHTLRHIQYCRQSIEDPASKKYSFLHLLRRLAISMNASDDRDLVYAFLAFQDLNRGQLVPDYSLETNEVYTFFSASIASSTKSLSILGLVRGVKYPGFLPSWAIDLRLQKSQQGSALDENLENTFESCRGYPYRTFGEFPQGNILRVYGKIIGTVTFVSSVTHTYGQPLQQTLRLEESVEDIISNLQLEGQSISPEGNETLSKRVLIVLSAQEMDSFKSDLDRETSAESILQAYRNYDRIVKKYETFENYADLVKAAEELDKRALMCCQKRVFYSQEELFGMGPGYMQEDDLICILHGSVVPCILREQEVGFEVIGQCYYENWMHGDLVDWGEDEGNAFDLI